ncbi:ovochymase [Aedes albopictus]|uniref:Peptidase S1 domain-containing protein n=1 Tax=Aedes albopictus TaxID=7160 RepID=A0ABM1YJW0_AEDAL|nr:trypsin 3A1 [Aedes albopictus]
MEFRTCLMVLFIGALDGGVDALGGRIAPYKAAIEYKGTVFCAGSIVETTWILTAARCVMNKTASYITVRLGATYSKEGFLVGVKSTHIHPKFNPESSRRAVGLLKLSTTLKYTLTIDSIPLVKPGYGMEEGTKCTIPSLLQSFSDIKAKLWSRERCISNYPKPFIFTDDALCAKISTGNVYLNQNGTSRNHTCNDQQQHTNIMLGSPLVCEGKLVAIVSHIEWQTQTATAGQCGSAIGSISGGGIEPTASASAAAGWGNKSGLPDVFSDVAFANQWISSHLSVKRKRKPVGGRRRSSSKLRQSQRRNRSERRRWSSGSGFVLAWVLVLNGLATR